MEEISIESAAPAPAILERPEPFRFPPDISIGDTFPGHVARLFLPPQETAEVRLYSLADVELDTACCLLWKEGRKIRETKYLLFHEHDRQARILPERLVQLPSDTSYALGYNNGRRNYYHWTAQVLPAISLTLQSLPQDRITLVVRKMEPWQEESLCLLKLDAVPRLMLDPHHHYAFPNLACCDVLWGRTAFQVSRQVARVLGQLKAAVPQKSEREGIIYVARTDAKNRVAVNEEDIVAFMRDQGVRIIVPGALSLPEQSDTFRSARAVIGPHGAGLSNVAFCEPGTILYEFIPQHYTNSCFARLAQATGLEYWADLFPSGGEGGVHQQTWTLNRDVIADRLAMLRKRLATPPSARPSAQAGAPAAPVFVPHFVAGLPIRSIASKPGVHAGTENAALAGVAQPPTVVSVPSSIAAARMAQRKRGTGPGSALTRKRVLVTGGAGFLGSHLCERLAGLGHDVLCVDNYFTGRKDNIAHLLGNPRFEAMRHDITFPLYVEVDEIYNLACPASPIHYQFDPVQTTKTSVIGAINMLGLAKRVGAKILQASTSEVYGDPSVHPQAEDYRGNVNTAGPRACYDEGKRCAETLFFDYRRQHGVRIKVARIFNTYGPRMHPNDGRVVSNFIMQALRGEDITLYGDGTQTRAFCYVDDLIEALIRMMDTSDDVAGPLNLGNPDEIAVRQLAETVLRLTRSRARIVYEPLPQDDPMQRCPDITAARATLGWQPVVKLEEGLRRTIAYFSQLLRDAQGADTLGGGVATRA